MQSYLEREARGIDYLVLWLDCDREGENICFEVIDSVRHVMQRPNDDRCILRSHFSSITEQDIKRAMQQLGTPNKNESLSVDARQELDLRIGCAFTRFQTRFFQGKYEDLYALLFCLFYKHVQYFISFSFFLAKYSLSWSTLIRSY